MNTANELQDLLLQAMEIIATSASKEEQKDKDITLWTCTIVDDTNKKSGEYKITDGSINFYAYSSYTDYKINDHVAVVIPKGDFSNTKYIVQKVAVDGTQLPFTSPLDNYIQITQDLVSDFSSKTLTLQEKTKRALTLPSSEVYSAKNSQKDSLYDALIFECDIQTYIDSFWHMKGSYGIKITLKYVNELNYPLEEIQYFDSKEFLGNPYGFQIPSTQKKAFHLTRKDSLKEILIDFYQNLSIKEYEGKGEDKLPKTPLVELKDIRIGFGSNIAIIPDDTLEIYTVDGLQYYGDKSEGTVENTKRLGLVWYNKNENNSFIGFSDGIYDAEYDEKAYLDSKATVALQESEAAKENAPKTLNGINLAVKLTTVEKAIETLTTEVNKLSSAAASMNRELSSVLSKVALTDEPSPTAQDFLDNLTDRSEEAYEKDKTLEKYCYDLTSGGEAFINGYRQHLNTKDVNIKFNFPIEALNSLDEYLTEDGSFDCIIGENVRDTIKNDFGFYYSLFESHNKRIEEYRRNILIERDKIMTAIESNDSFEVAFAARNEGNAYASEFDESDYANRYCIYWYKYEKGSVDDFAGTDWTKLDDWTNFGFPAPGDFSQGNMYNDRISTELKSYTLSPNAIDETVMAILFYNHNQYKSQPLHFIKTTSDGAIIDTNGILKIEHGSNSKEGYQLYDTDGYLINSVEARRERILLPSFSSILDRTLDDFNGGEIYWYLPKNTTMLRYKEDSGILAGYAVSDGDKPGYYCFTKLIKKQEEEPQIVTQESLQFSYMISNFYSSAYVNNTIYCKIVKGTWKYEAAINFAFSSFGTDGTDYTLMISPAPGGPFALNKEKAMPLYFKLLDYNGKELPLRIEEPTKEIPEVYGVIEEISLITPIAKTVLSESGYMQKDNEVIGYTIAKSSSVKYGLFRIEVTIYTINSSNMTIAGYYEVPYAVNERDYAEGATKIVYSTTGNNPRYYKDPYRLYNGNDGTIRTCTWSVLTNGESYENIKIENNCLTPSNIFIKTVNDCLVAQAKDENDNVLWYQPIHFYQDKYELGILNHWDGKFQINENEGYILSNMLVAGDMVGSPKVFSGVVIGDLSTLKPDALTNSGIFGFNQGICSFGFKTDGTAFLGKSGSGRIDFNGDKGTITSAGYSAGTGIFLDLDGPEFSIKKEKKQVMLVNYRESNNDFYLQTYDFNPPRNEDETGGTGTKIDLKKGTITAYSGFTIKTAKDNYITLTDGKVKIRTQNFSAGSENNEISLIDGAATIKATTFNLQTTNLQLNSAPEKDTDYHLNIGGKITYTKKGDLTLKPSNFILSGGDNSSISLGGFQVDQSGFSLGFSDNYIKGNSSGIQIVTNNFTAGSGNNQISVTSDSTSIKATSFNLNSGVIQVSSNTFEGIKYGDVFYAKESGFKVGSPNAYISGDENTISFNFATGLLSFSSGTGLNYGDMITINSGAQVLKSNIFQIPTVGEDGVTIPGEGMKIDLNAGTIEAYSGLTIVTNDFNLSADNGNFVISSGGGDIPLIQFGKLFKASKEEFYLQTNNFVEKTENGHGAGMKIDLQGNTITAYSGFILTSYKDDKYISIDTTTTQENNVFNVNNNLKIKWDGSITIGEENSKKAFFASTSDIRMHGGVNYGPFFLRTNPDDTKLCSCGLFFNTYNYSEDKYLAFLGFESNNYNTLVLKRGTEYINNNSSTAQILKIQDFERVDITKDLTVKGKFSIDSFELKTENKRITSGDSYIYRPVLGELWYSKTLKDLPEDENEKKNYVNQYTFTIGLKKPQYISEGGKISDEPRKHGSITFEADGDITFSKFVREDPNGTTYQTVTLSKIIDLFNTLGVNLE